jgi:hypothetical protein
MLADSSWEFLSTGFADLSRSFMASRLLGRFGEGCSTNPSPDSIDHMGDSLVALIMAAVPE